MSFDVFYMQTSRHYRQFFYILCRGILIILLCVVHTQIHCILTSLHALYFPSYHALSLIYTVHVSLCARRQNVVTCGLFSCYLTFNAVLIVGRKVMSCGYACPCVVSQHHRKELLSGFHLNGYTLGFHPQTQTLKPPSTA